MCKRLRLRRSEFITETTENKEGCNSTSFFSFYLWLINRSPAATAVHHSPSRKVSRPSTQSADSPLLSVARNAATSARRTACPPAKCTRQRVQSAEQHAKCRSSRVRSQRAVVPSCVSTASRQKKAQPKRSPRYETKAGTCTGLFLCESSGNGAQCFARLLWQHLPTYLFPLTPLRSHTTVGAAT